LLRADAPAAITAGGLIEGDQTTLGYPTELLDRAIALRQSPLTASAHPDERADQAQHQQQRGGQAE
jgi:hypothetical protein